MNPMAIESITLAIRTELISPVVTAEALQKIVAERAAQDEQHGDPENELHEWVSLLTEDVGEAARAANKAVWGDVDMPFEIERVMRLERKLIQVAALACAAYEDIHQRVTLPLFRSGAIQAEEQDS